MSRRRGGAAARNNTSKFRDKDRKYGLGRRNPHTLSGESPSENRFKTRQWSALRGWAASISSVGAKYV